MCTYHIFVYSCFGCFTSWLHFFEISLPIFLTMEDGEEVHLDIVQGLDEEEDAEEVRQLYEVADSNVGSGSDLEVLQGLDEEQDEEEMRIVVKALRVEMLAHVSRTFFEHRMLDPCVSPVPLGTVASLNFETAHAVLAEVGGLAVCVRLLRAWHHGEALHAAFLKLSLTKVCSPDAAQCVIAVLYGQCRGTACSCHCVVSRWKRLINVT